MSHLRKEGGAAREGRPDPDLPGSDPGRRKSLRSTVDRGNAAKTGGGAAGGGAVRASRFRSGPCLSASPTQHPVTPHRAAAL